MSFVNNHNHLVQLLDVNNATNLHPILILKKKIVHKLNI